MKRIAVVSGSRSDYGLLKSLLQEIKKTKDLQLQVFVTGSHLQKKYGLTVEEVKQDGFPITAAIKLPLFDGGNYEMAQALGLGVTKFAKALQDKKPDCVIVLGDRVEILAAALASFYLNIPLAHIHGGDVSLGGHLDDSVRHAITKLAHLHFAATKASKQRIIKLGEEAWRVFFVGAPGLDSIMHQKIHSRKDLSREFGIEKGEEFLLLVQNPITTEAEQAGNQMEETLKAIQKTGMKTVVVYPNADAGGKRMIDVIDKYQDNKIRAFRNIKHDFFLSLMKHCTVMVGNSSSALIEAPSFRSAAVDVGNRQKGRERTANVIWAKNSSHEIYQAIKRAMSKTFIKKLKTVKSPYWNGWAAKKIVAVLKKIDLKSKKIVQKKLTY